MREMKKPINKPLKKPIKKRAAPKKVSEEKQRRDFEHNQELISAEFFRLIAKQGKLPTMAKIAAATNLSVKTIDRHLKTPSFKETKDKLRSINDMMLAQFAQKVSKSNNPGMWDMYWTLTESEYVHSKSKKTVDVTSNGETMKPNVAAVINFNGTEIEIM